MSFQPFPGRLYYENPLQDEADAVVLEVRQEGKTALVHLDQTIFYPEGGGQPADWGWLGGLPVRDVQEVQGQIWHKVEIADDPSLHQPLPQTGQMVHLVIDWQRRRDHMQQHSGQHLLSAILEQEYGIHTLSFHLGKETCTIDITAGSPDDLPASDIEAQLEAWIRRDAPIRVHYCPPEDLEAFHLRKRPPAGESVVRIVEIDQYDWSPCGGTHLSSTGPIRLVKILGLERYKGNVRLYFAAGDRAAGLLMAVYEEARKSAGSLGCGIADLAVRTVDLSGKLSAAEREAGRYLLKWAEAEAKAGSILCGPSQKVLVFEGADITAMEAAELAKAATRMGKACIAVSRAESTVIVQVPAQAGWPSLGTLLKPIADSLHGKGGGGPALFRARFVEKEELERFIEAARTLLLGR